MAQLSAVGVVPTAPADPENQRYSLGRYVAQPNALGVVPQDALPKSVIPTEER